MAKALDLRPNKNLIDSDFEGYKLSLQEIPRTREKIPIGIHKVQPNNDQFSYKHARLFSTHNHLIGEKLDGIDYIYFIDKHLRVNKTQLEAYSTSLAELRTVWKVPKTYPAYNLSLQFASTEVAVLSDGAGKLYILNRAEHSDWKEEHCHDFIFPFVIQHCIIDENGALICLLFRIESEKSVLSKCKFTKINDVWHFNYFIEYKSNGEFYCGYLQNDAIFMASESSFLQTSNEKSYVWTQTSDSIIVHVKIPKDKALVNCNDSDFTVMYEGNVIIKGKLHDKVSEISTQFEDGVLEVLLIKVGIWPEFLIDDEQGVFVSDLSTLGIAIDGLRNICSENEVFMYNDEMEECDYPRTSNAVFERIVGDAITHRALLGTRHVSFTQKLQDQELPSLAVNHNEDVCIWQPEFEEDFNLKHVGTLMAFGYVEASKQRKKFSLCSPDLSYAVICDGNRHIFVYRQWKTVTSGELRNRKDGKMVRKIAQQQVIDLGDEIIHGVYSANSTLYILCENYVYALNMRDQ